MSFAYFRSLTRNVHLKCLIFIKQFSHRSACPVTIGIIENCYKFNRSRCKVGPLFKIQLPSIEKIPHTRILKGKELRPIGGLEEHVTRERRVKTHKVMQLHQVNRKLPLRNRRRSIKLFESF